MKYPILFSPFELGSIQIKNRLVMAPMTRSRAIGNIPNELMAKYYSDRAAAGLLITEGASPSPNGLGYSRIPGMYSPEQIKGWKVVTDAVHENGGHIFIQLMHTGRIAHPLNIPEGAIMVAPSAIAAPGKMWTDSAGMQEHPVPNEIPEAGIPAIIQEFVHSAKAAMEAGFDGVEIHAANGYLPMQFLNPGSNQRTDNYGGNYENRNRFVLELAEAMAHAIGKEKVGIRLSPFNKFNGLSVDENESAQYIALAEGLKKLGLVYLHLMRFTLPAGFADQMHEAFGGPLMMNGGFNAETAEAELEAGKCEMISIGRAFISNPDLVHRMQTGAVLATPDESSFYTPGEKGYTDYKTL